MTVIAVYFLQFLQISLVLFGAFYLYYDWKLGVAAVPSSSAAVRTVAAMLPAYAGATVVDVGSGWGGMAFAAARACPDKKVIGIEFAAMPYFYARLRQVFNPRLKNLQFLHMDLFQYDFSQTAIVFCYMPPEMMLRLRPKLAELPPGAVIISNSEALVDMTPETIAPVPGLLPEKIYVYRVA